MNENTKSFERQNKLLMAVLHLMVADISSRSSERMELRLAEAGLEYQDIALLLGKKPDAVRMLLKRNKVT